MVYFICLLICSSVLYADLVSDITSQEQQLTQKKAELVASKAQLQSIHDQLKTQLIDSINASVDTLNTQIDSLSSTKRQVKDVPGGKVTLTVVGVGDLPGTLDDIIDTLDATKKILSTISSRFSEIVTDLNSQADPKQIYSNLDQSAKSMDDAIAELKTIEEFAKGLAAAAA